MVVLVITFALVLQWQTIMFSESINPGAATDTTDYKVAAVTLIKKMIAVEIPLNAEIAQAIHNTAVEDNLVSYGQLIIFVKKYEHLFQ